MDNLGKILNALSEIPETAVYGLEYTSTKLEELKREVLKKAAADAKEKATNLAEGAGAIVGKVIKIESASPFYAMRSDRTEGREMLMMKQEVAKTVPQIESGSLEITGNCTVYYSIQ
jgi:uncharacterized protein YggE